MATAIVKHPTTREEMGYQRASDFVSGIVIGGPAPDGAAITLAGEPTTLHAALNADKPTILNFGSCT